MIWGFIFCDEVIGVATAIGIHPTVQEGFALAADQGPWIWRVGRSSFLVGIFLKGCEGVSGPFVEMFSRPSLGVSNSLAGLCSGPELCALEGH
jgi:hypothetical protein